MVQVAAGSAALHDSHFDANTKTILFNGIQNFTMLIGIFYKCKFTF